MKVIIVVMMACLLSGCGSIISRTIPGQGTGISTTPAYSGMSVIPHGAISPCSICRFR